jgi:hypothetical protein
VDRGAAQTWEKHGETWRNLANDSNDPQKYCHDMWEEHNATLGGQMILWRERSTIEATIGASCGMNLRGSDQVFGKSISCSTPLLEM